jgi:hypothetical protein
MNVNCQEIIPWPTIISHIESLVWDKTARKSQLVDICEEIKLMSSTTMYRYT